MGVDLGVLADQVVGPIPEEPVVVEVVVVEVVVVALVEAALVEAALAVAAQVEAARVVAAARQTVVALARTVPARVAQVARGVEVVVTTVVMTPAVKHAAGQ